ncbi:DUF5134 domain-containing protein [Promicromonospora sukumoe]|uniref:DUF5134 domain-containing protein n=1 Tax=Promicromonospora sukumoe TaxID=88382 RepID=UPI0037C845DE
MTSDPVVQWATTALFGVLGAHSLWRLATTRQPFDAASHLLHLGMSAVMVAMVWPWWARLPALPQVAFFALGAAVFAGAAGWYGLGALGPGAPGRGAPARGPTTAAPSAGHHRSARCQVVHAVMMLAMVWALAVMTGPAGHGAGRAFAGAGTAAPGAGGHGAGAHGAGHVATLVPLDTTVLIAGVVLAVVLVAGGALFLADLVRHLRCCGSLRDGTGSDLLAGALMSFGTAAMCGLMLIG